VCIMNGATHLLYATLVVCCLSNVMYASPVCYYGSLVLACIAYLDHSLLERRFQKEIPSEEEKRHHRVAASVMNIVCAYDPVQRNGSLARFQTVQRNSRCLFAKAALIWGCAEWDVSKSLEDNVARSIPTLNQFLLRGEQEGLDGFLFEVRGKEYFKDIDTFGQTVRRVLTAISENDPNRMRFNPMRATINRSGWYFSFASEPIFVTTFAPLYDKHSSRYMYLDRQKKLPAVKFAHSPNKVATHGQAGDAEYDSCFVLLQPEYSFLVHNLESDTPHTNWQNPQTMRDRIRCAFRKVGQEYEIPSTTSYPSAPHIVKPLNWRSDSTVEWWRSSKSLGVAE